MPSSLFFARLIPNRPNFAMSMTADEQATMRAHGEFLQDEVTPMGPTFVRPVPPAGA